MEAVGSSEISIEKKIVGWSELLPELINEVAKRITIYADYIRFSAVCKKWMKSLSSTPPSHLPPQFPWVLFCSSEIRSNQIDFFNLLENKVQHLNLQEVRSNDCHGSSLGWLILLEGRSSNIIMLMNPLTKVQFKLPPFTFDESMTLDISMKKVVLSSNPISQDFVSVVFSSTGELGFYKKGDESWTFIGEAQSYSEDVIYYNNSFYIVNGAGSLAICDVINGVLTLVSTITPPPPESLDLSDDFIFYLVNSFGELLLVLKFYLDDPEVQNRTYKPTFNVYRLDPSEQKWEPVSSLDDRMLFVGGGYSSSCLLATDFSGCEGNRIYFIDHLTSRNGNKDHYMGVYDLANGSIKWTPMFSSMSWSDPVPIWFTPNPC